MSTTIPRGQTVTGPRCPSVTCRSTDVYFVKVDDERPDVGWFHCNADGCETGQDFDAFLTGVRPVSTTTVPRRNTCETTVITRARQALADHKALNLGTATSVDFMSAATHLAYAMEGLLQIVANLQALADHAQAEATGGAR